MKRYSYIALGTLLSGLVLSSSLISKSHAADAGKDGIKEFMKLYHKAPKGVDPVCKKAVDGKASPDEIKKLLAGYKLMAAAKPPRGDEASWKEKTTALVTAFQALEKGEAGAAAKYKEALNCKACHSAHKPE